MTDPIDVSDMARLRTDYPWAADAIEDLQQFKAWAEPQIEHYSEQKAEIERLERIITDKEQIQDEQAAIISGLREALEDAIEGAAIISGSIARATPWSVDFLRKCQRLIAREALGPAQETPARIPPREFDIESHTGLYTEPAQETKP